MGLLWFHAQTVYPQTDGRGADDGVLGSAVEPADDGAPVPQPTENRSLPREEDLVFSTDGADAPDAADGADEDLSTFGVWDLLRMVLVLLLVVGAVYGLITLLRRRVGSEPEEDDSPIRVLASRNLGGAQELHAVMVGKKVLLLGGGEAGLQLISTIDDQETVDELVLFHSSGSAGGAGRRTFGAVAAQWLGNLTVPGTHAGRSGRGKKADGQAAGHAAGGGFLRSQQDRLRHLR